MQSKISIRISPAFWITAAIIGWLNSRSLMGVIIWIGIIFISVLVHELGHALSARAFGQSPRIELIAFGGVTTPIGPKLSLGKEFVVVFCGPLFGFGLFLLATLLLKVPSIAMSSLAPILQVFRLVNLFWSVVNLLPVLPLDGGQLLRIIFQACFGSKGIKLAVGVGLVLASLLAIYFFIMGYFLVGAIFFLFVFQNIQSWKFTKTLSSSDQNQDIQQEMIVAEEELLRGQEGDAEKHLESVRKKAKEGMIFISATQDLATIKFKKRDVKATYDLLKEIEKDISHEYLGLFHYVAFEMQDYKSVIKLSASCFQLDPSLEIALRNAIAFASEKEVKSCIGWLEAAVRSGLENLSQILEEKAFDPIRNDPDFIFFMNNHKMPS